MIYIVVSLIALVMFMFVLPIVMWGISNDVKKRGESAPGGAAWFVLGFVVYFLFMVAFTAGSSIRTVPAGHVGLVYTFNDITGQRSAGINLILPWQGFKTVTVQTQKIVPEGTCSNGTENCLGAFSQETQDVFVVAAINLHVDPDDIQNLFRNVGPDYINKLVLIRLDQIFKDETVKFVSTDIAPNRETIRTAVRERLREELADFSIVVEDLLIIDLDFPQGFKDAIEAKQQAEQEAQRQEELIRSAEAQAAQAVAIAQGEADANTILAESLEKQGNFILQFRAIEALADNVTIMLLPTENGLIPVLGESLLRTATP
jgi:regulator of protease activity HflC (stomatin/prohibitin superfamily)